MAVNMTQLDPVRGSYTISLPFPSTALLNETDWHQREVSGLPRLTEEEEAALLYHIHLAHQGGFSLHQAKAAKQRLIEGYLPRVVTLARQYDRQYRVVTFDNLVQEGSLALIQAIDKCATLPITKSLSAYVGTVVRSAFARAIACDAPIHMPNATWHYIHKTGRAHEFAWMQTMRLDVPRNADGETFAELLVAPASVIPLEEQDQTQGRLCPHAAVPPATAPGATSSVRGCLPPPAGARAPPSSETLSAAAHVDHRAACMFVKLHSKQSAKRARIRSTPVQQRLEEGYTQMVERGECLSISGLKVAAHVGSAPARAFLRSRGAPPQKGGPPEKPSTLYPTRRHEHKASLRENESFYEKQRGV